MSMRIFLYLLPVGMLVTSVSSMLEKVFENKRESFLVSVKVALLSPEKSENTTPVLQGVPTTWTQLTRRNNKLVVLKPCYSQVNRIRIQSTKPSVKLQLLMGQEAVLFTAQKAKQLNKSSVLLIGQYKPDISPKVDSVLVEYNKSAGTAKWTFYNGEDGKSAQLYTADKFLKRYKREVEVCK